MENKILYGYLRQSKEDNGEGYSIQYQKDIGERVRKRFGFNKIIFFNEGSGVSGTTNPFERKLGRELIEKIQNGEVKDIVLSAVTNDGWALEYASDRLKDDNDVVLEATEKDRSSLKFASDRLKIKYKTRS